MGISLSYIDLRGLPSIDDVLEKIRERARETEKGAWIVGYRWDESKWRERRYITRFDLDKVTPDNPVMLKRMDGHLWVVNTKGLEAAGVPDNNPGMEKDPSTGEPTGLLRWGAKSFVAKCLTPGTKEMMNGLKLAVNEALKYGVTTVNEFVANIPFYQEAEKSGTLLVRVYMGMGEDVFSGMRGGDLNSPMKFPESGSDLLTLGPVKMFADGSIGARTAALFEPYCDDASTSGQLAAAPEKLRERISKVHKADTQVAVHAIGDRGINTLLDAFESILDEYPRSDHRHRIEHAEILNDELMDRSRDLGLVLSMQPNFIGEWGGPGELYEKRLGSRYRTVNPLRAILDRHIPVAFGSDCMPFGPMYGIWSAVNNPIQESRISLHEAIYCYTLGAAYACFEEDIKGSIQKGKLADLIILSSTDLPEDQLKDIPVEMTIVGGRILYGGKQA
jgi:predicted amidohydrolase YtcJ